jgi:ACS family glucarate transporter-like MFS transporter
MNKRYLLVTGTFLLTLLLYVDRICISVAKDPISKALDLSNAEMGWVMSAFALGYALLQTPSGMLADRLGPRKVLTIIVTLWSVFTTLTAYAWNYISLLVIRLLFGAGEAGAFPGISRAVYSWIPLKERGLITGINFSGSRLGAAFALPALSILMAYWGWKSTFFLLGAIGVVWAVFWFWLFRDKPENHRGITAAEKAYIIENRQPAAKGIAKISVRQLFASRNMWLAMVQYFCSNFTFFFALTWLYPHVKSTYQLDSLAAGWYAALPFFAGALGNWFSGWWVDKIYKTGNWRSSRLKPATVGFLLSAVGLLGGVLMTEVNGAVFFLSLAIFGADMTLPPSWSFCVDIGKENAGAVSGNMNMAGNLGSFITSLAFPYLLLWAGTPNFFFYIAAGLSVLGVLVWQRMNPEKPIGIQTIESNSNSIPTAFARAKK